MVVFACQRDSFMKEYSSTVVSCGGQPYDLGLLNGVPVLKVLRRGAEAVHYVETPLEEGVVVKQEIDWKRRLDHMQQHSGQHLITAIADVMFGYATTSWWLGEEVSHIELDTGKLTLDEVSRLEDAVNEKILEALPVTVDVLLNGDPQLDATRTRGLPKDHVGDVRIVTIVNVEANMCCGTHVSNLSQLQSVKLLGVEKGKKGKTNLQFLVGGRVLSRLDKLHKRELELNLLLNSGPDSHVMLVDKLIKANKAVNKNLQTALKDCALAEISKFKSIDPRPKFFHHHRKDGEMDYINFFIREFNEPQVLLFLAIGESDGHIVLFGPPEHVMSLGPQVSDILDGKGNGKGQRFQAKVKNLKSLPKAVVLCQDVFT